MPVSSSARTLVVVASLALLCACAAPTPRDDARTGTEGSVETGAAPHRPATATTPGTTNCRDRESTTCAPSRREAPVPSAGRRGAVQHATRAHPDVPRGSGVQRGSARQDGRRFWVKDRHRYRSPWYAGAHRRMINFGCTAAPYYAPDPRCGRGRGFHHGLDIAMPCGTRLFSALRARVVQPGSAGALGSAYGRNAFRLRNPRFGVDIVLGHTRKVYVRPGDRVGRGELIARASDMGAPDGCHLHFEVRPRAGSVEQAMPPRPRLRLRAVR
jgi:murein DD-endopeptidase MepM/ murein hydrolase activator NlpD